MSLEKPESTSLASPAMGKIDRATDLREGKILNSKPGRVSTLVYHSSVISSPEKCGWFYVSPPALYERITCVGNWCLLVLISV